MATNQAQSFSPATLNEKEIEKIRSFEQQLSQELNKSIIVLAYENQTH
jgi:hypothetical protein